MEQCSGLTQENGSLDYLLFNKDSLHTPEKENTKPAKSILAPIINPVHDNTVTNSVYTKVICSSFKDRDFPPLKHSSLVNISRSNISRSNNSLQLFIKL